MKIYTKTGDKGKTSLYDGSRHSKFDEVFDVLGDIDELSSHIGLLYTQLYSSVNDEPTSHPGLLYTQYEPDNRNINTDFLRIIQCRLQTINSLIATPESKKASKLTQITEEDVKYLENQIDLYSNSTPPLKVFILPGVTVCDSQAHVCRSVCRRAERRFIRLHPEEETFVLVKQYLNRLSDLFFAYARFVCYDKSHTDVCMSDWSTK